MAAARDGLDRLPALLARIPQDSEYLPALVQSARIVHAVGGHEVGAQLYELLLPHRHRFAVEGIAGYCHGSVERFLGLLALVVGRSEAAEHLALARQIHRDIGASF